ncbi:hypothetical protein [Sphingomonas sp.]|uniref:hypothetical protein n=1 Tax=Sphingomonas sp. TaxID=28214 RepID=UPI003B00AB5A
MRFKTLFATAAVAAMLTTTTAATAAVANPAASLSIAHGRAASPSTNRSALGAEVGTSTLISIGVLAALVVIVLVATKDGDDSDSN